MLTQNAESEDPTGPTPQQTCAILALLHWFRSMTNQGLCTRVWAWMRILIVSDAYGPAYATPDSRERDCNELDIG